MDKRFEKETILQNGKRGWLIGLIVFVLVAGAGDTLLWRQAETRLGDAYRDLTNHLQAEGFSVSQRAIHRNGWPFAARLTVEGAQAIGANGVTIGADRLSAAVSLFTPWSVNIDLHAPVTIAAQSGARYTVQAKSLSVTLSASGDGGSVDGRNIQLETDGAPQLSLSELTGDVTRKQDQLILSARVEILQWAQQNNLTLAWGDRLSSISFDATTTLLPSLGGSSPAAEWRAQNGRLLAQRLAFGWGPLGFDGHFDLTLDSGLHPVVDGGARLLGYPNAISALARVGIIKPDAATAAKAALGLLADPESPGETPEVTLPFSVQNGIVSAAGFPLFRLYK